MLHNGQGCLKEYDNGWRGEALLDSHQQPPLSEHCLLSIICVLWGVDNTNTRTPTSWAAKFHHCGIFPKGIYLI